MSHLLGAEKIMSRAASKGGTLLFQEIEVPPELGPYLVTSSTSLLWLPEALKKQFVRAAFRHIKPSQLYVEIIEAIADKAKELEWGNCHPYTEQGLEKAIEHLHYYDLSGLDILVHVDQTHVFAATAAKHSHTLMPTVWVPLNCAVVVPTDRYYLGVLGVADAETTLASVHNASRGIALAWDRSV